MSSANISIVAIKRRALNVLIAPEVVLAAVPSCISLPGQKICSPDRMFINDCVLSNDVFKGKVDHHLDSAVEKEDGVALVTSIFHTRNGVKSCLDARKFAVFLVESICKMVDGIGNAIVQKISVISFESAGNDFRCDGLSTNSSCSDTGNHGHAISGHSGEVVCLEVGIDCPGVKQFDVVIVRLLSFEY